MTPARACAMTSLISTVVTRSSSADAPPARSARTRARAAAALAEEPAPAAPAAYSSAWRRSVSTRDMTSSLSNRRTGRAGGGEEWGS